MSGRHHRSIRGYSVVELLVALAITVVLAGILLGITVQVLRSYDRTAGRVASISQARVALDIIVADLQGIVFRHDGQIWFVADVVNSDQNSRRHAVANPENMWKQPSSPTRQKPPVVSLDANRFGVNGVWLRFISRPVDRDRLLNPGNTAILGDVCAVAYQIFRRGPTVASEGPGTQDSGHRSYDLYRTVVNADRTWQTGFDLTDTASAYWSGDNTPLLGEPIEILRPDRGSVIASNVVEFGVRLLDEDLEEIEFTPHPPGPLVGAGALTYRAPTASQPIPAFVDVYLRVLNGDGARIILAFEQGKHRTDLTVADERRAYWWEVVQSYSVELRRRVAIRSTPIR